MATAGLPLAGVFGAMRASAFSGPEGEKTAGADMAPPVPGTLPDKGSFILGSDDIYFNSGSQHPVSKGARLAIDNYYASRMRDPDLGDYRLQNNGPLEKFARLMNADISELTYVQSTTTGEQMVLKALGLPDGKSHIITDTLHFFGSLPLYAEMEKQGNKVTWLRERDGRIDLEDMRKALKGGAKLVSLSLVSTINGFQHDLKAVCDMAHAAGAYVYADIIHAAGCVPVDLHASGVDFAATASYKWLMGDFGLGFLYVRKQVQDDLKRTNYGYYGMNAFAPHIYPFDEPGDTIVDYGFSPNAAGQFALGTYSHSVVAQLNHSLDYIQALGVENIQTHAQAITSYLKQALPELGYTLYTPLDAQTPMVSCVLEDARTKLGALMKAHNISLSISKNRFRFSVSVFNTLDEAKHVVEVLKKAAAG